MVTRKKVPLRKCVASGEMKNKKELVRIVRSKEGEVSIDPSGKKAGRGAYISLDKDLISLARKKNILANQLKVSIPDELYVELLQMADKENIAGNE